MKTTSPIKPAKYSAKQIADYFIYLSSKIKIDENTAEGVSPLKLQKLLYFGQAVSLSLYGKKLFEDPIEAWKYGPVISSLYHDYKTNLNLPLTEPSGDYEAVADKETKELLQGVWELFGKYSAGELVEMTHKHRPWKDNYIEGVNNQIPVDEIREYYSGIFELQEDK